MRGGEFLARFRENSGRLRSTTVDRGVAVKQDGDPSRKRVVHKIKKFLGNPTKNGAVSFVYESPFTAPQDQSFPSSISRT